MSIDILQEKIRKTKNPSVVDFCTIDVPDSLLQECGNLTSALKKYCTEILSSMENLVPAVRFHLTSFILLKNGMQLLSEVLAYAKEKDYFVFLDIPGASSAMEVNRIAKMVFEDNAFSFDALIVQPFLGSDGIKPYVTAAKNNNKSLVVIARTPNKSALELQDLLVGTRVVHHVIIEMVKRFGESMIGKNHYSEIGALVSATNGSAVKSVRTSFPEVFLLVDGLDLVGGNASNCSNGFDRFGHGAIVCAGDSVVNAWKKEENKEKSYVEAAVSEVERMRKNITRYVKVM